jgi:hypothetical protein
VNGTQFKTTTKEKFMSTGKLLHISVKLSLLFLALFMLSSCSSVSSKNNRYYPVMQHTPRENSLGFSISPPPGNNWYEKLRDNSLIYLKKDQPKTYAIYTQATEIILESPISKEKELIEYVKKRKNGAMNSSRYKNIKFQYNAQQSPSQQCVRYNNNFEDHGVKNLAKETFVIVKSSGVFCLHPDTPNVGIDLYYFEKSISGADSISYQNEGEQFLSSLNFSTIRL